jgi:hypothetical protein
MSLRNFGLSCSRRGAGANAGVTWRPRHGVGLVTAVIVIAVIVLALFGG